MACFDEQQREISCEEWESQHAARVQETHQIGSQWWLNYDYLGPEPTLDVKLSTTDQGSADYARDVVSILVPDWAESHGYPTPDPVNVKQYWENLGVPPVLPDLGTGSGSVIAPASGERPLTSRPIFWLVLLGGGILVAWAMSRRGK